MVSVSDTSTQKIPVKTSPLRVVIRIIGALVILPVIVLVILALSVPITIFGWLYIAGVVSITVGICGMAWGRKRLRYGLGLGIGLLIAVVIVRLILVNRGSHIRMLTLPDQNSVCIVNCLIDEQDAALLSTRVLPLIGWISPTEQEGLVDAMYAGYQAMGTAQALSPSPFVRTYLSLQHPGAFDAVIIASAKTQPELGVIFLHGFTGNFTMPCWLVARAVYPSGGLTVCPSVGWRGDWWIADGEATLRATIDYVRGRGIKQIYLAGLSNGAVGASELAYKLTDDLSGLILISGASPSGLDSGLPVLVLAGTNDERMPTDMMQAYADRMGANATFVELDADHFMLAKKAAEIQGIITSWMQGVDNQP